ncbi:LarC family nickel insertion protein [Paenibacillus filicis]|uniref:LarC family nickel insertion protein n=1 Tax=Paenibacillus filicis TaxID=669464 RepID=A0ABU9DL84_9BACL
MKILYLDCFSGISGDMTLAALVDAGADRGYIEEELRKIQIEPFSLEWKRVNKKGISSLKADVLLDPSKPPQHHRHYSEIVSIIEGAGFNERVVKLSLSIFEKIAVAEAKIHDIPIERVHFHEVGAIDSIVDVIGVALAIDSLDIEKVLSSAVPLGSGTVHCDHGIYPVPAPATLEMMRGLPIATTTYSMEMTTPTGAGIIAGLVEEFAKGLPPMIVESIGYGAGTRDLPNQPNVLRAVVGKADPFMNKWQVHHEELQHAHTHHHHHHDEHHHHHDEHHHHHEHGHSHSHDHEHEHSHEHEHHHGHAHDHNHDHHGHGYSHSHSHDHHEHSHTHDHDHHHHGHEHEDHHHGHKHSSDHDGHGHEGPAIKLSHDPDHELHSHECEQRHGKH